MADMLILRAVGKLIELLHGRAVVGRTSFVGVVGGNLQDGDVVLGLAFTKAHAGVSGAYGHEDVLCFGVVKPGGRHGGLRANIQEILAGHRKNCGKQYYYIFDSFHDCSSLEIQVCANGIDGLHGINRRTVYACLDGRAAYFRGEAVVTKQG